MSYTLKPLALIPTAPAFAPGAHLVTVQGGADVKVPLSALPGSGFDVTAYGAVSGGVVECAAKIQDAIAACAGVGGGTVYFPPGIYLTESPVTVPAGVRLLGYYATIISSAPANGAKIIINGSNVIIEGLTLDGAKSGTSGSGTFDYGLAEVIRNNSVAYTHIEIRGCRFKNSDGIGVVIKGNVDGVTLEKNTFSGNFLDVFGEKAGSYVFRNLRIRWNHFYATWFTGTYSGAIKLKGDVANSLYPRNIDITGNFIRNSAEMGIETFDGVNDCFIANNQVDGSIFGISVNFGRNVTVLGNKTWRNAYVGIEIAEGSNQCLIQGNTVEQYTTATGTTRGGDAGIITSGTVRCSDNIFITNTVRGTNKGIDCQSTDRATLAGNRIYDCTVLLQIKNSNYVTAEANHLYGPCTFHLFCDFTNNSCTNLDFVRNYLYGAASQDNIIFYRGATSHTLSNVRVAYNNLTAATFGNLSFNTSSIPNSGLPNLQCYENYFIEGTGKAVWPDFTTNAAAIPPYAASIQAGGISVAGKGVVSAPSSASARWVKVFSYDYGLSLYLQAHFFARNPTNGETSRIGAIFAAKPYDGNSSIAVFPFADFDGIIEEIIYNNSGTIQEVWLKLKATAYAWTIDCHFSEHAPGVVASPTLTTTQPTWASNSYRVQKEVDRSHAIQSAGIKAQRWIACGPRGLPALLKGRLHIRGVGDEGGDSPARIAIFEKDDGSECLGVNAEGESLVKLGLRIGASGTDAKIVRIASGMVTASYSTIGANDSAAYGCSCPGARSANNPAISVGFAPVLPNGVVLASAVVSADDVVEVRLRNVTGSPIAVGDITVRTTCFQY